MSLPTNAASERLRRVAPRIMKLWEERALAEVAAAEGQESLALQNSLPEYLGQLSDALSTTIHRSDHRVQADRLESERIGRKHGRERAGSAGYTMTQVIYEYHILRQVICQMLEEEAPLSPREREIITLSVEQAVNDAATQFSETLRDIQEQMTRGLAHDLRGPITSARMRAQLVLRRPDDVEHCIRMASRIANSMDRLESMIRDILDAGHLRAGQRLELTLSDCDADLVAHQIADELNLADDGRIRVRSAGPCIGRWDENAIRRILENLVGNAMKYGAPGTPVTLGVTQTTELAILTVHNEGPPITPEDQAILFQQYRRMRPATAPGWGIGLTVVHGLVEAHHGRVGVTSREGEGTTFTVELPKRAGVGLPKGG